MCSCVYVNIYVNYLPKENTLIMSFLLSLLQGKVTLTETRQIFGQDKSLTSSYFCINFVTLTKSKSK